MAESDEIITPLDVEQRYRIPQSSQKKARANGSFAPYFRVGRRVYYRRSTLESWMTAQELQAAGGHRG